MSTKKYLHLTQEDRIEIQECLSHGMTFKAIGKRIGKDQTTVSKEVKKHLDIMPTTCKRPFGGAEPTVCAKLLKPPFCCNPCPKAHTQCAFDRHVYRAKPAHSQYERLLVDAREGVALNKPEFYELDRNLSEAINNGQHLYHILKTQNARVSVPTVYRYFKKGFLSVSPIDLPRAVKFKARRIHKPEHIPQGLKAGRSYADFLAFTQKNGISSWVEFDTVIGRTGGKAIVTFDFTACNFMFGLLVDNKFAAEVSRKVSAFKQRLLDNGLSFGAIFRVLLTDNGGEFADVFTFENDFSGYRESRVFFCEPFHSNQKPRVEKYHTLFRDIAPQGASFDGFTQETVNVIFSHVNSVKRASLNGKSPYDVFSFLYGENVAATLGIGKIAAENVVQSPKLLKTLGVTL